MSTAQLPNLPLSIDLESRAVLRAAATAHRFLAELKGAAATIPNQAILINTLGLQEAKDSSEIERIVTTHDELYQSQLFEPLGRNPAAKEVRSYAFALGVGFDRVRETGLISIGDLQTLNELVTERTGGFRKVPGTSLKNDQTGEVIYLPPQHPDEIDALMGSLVRYINDPDLCDLDPLVKMALIHHQFESIHPFYDGNGRVGRILNILYLVAQGLLEIPVLYLSRFIVRNKAEYYRLLQATRDDDDWEPWLLYILGGVAETSQATLATVRSIGRLMMGTKHRLRQTLPKVYSQELLNNLFRHPYTKIDFVMRDLRVSRPTASRHLHALVDAGFLLERKSGRSKYFINEPLVRLLWDVESPGSAASRE